MTNINDESQVSRKIRKLLPTETELITKIADLYYAEWETPKDSTISKLSDPSPNNVLIQLVLFDQNNLISTGGIRQDVGILKVYPHLAKFGPWISLLYTDHPYRGKGNGEFVLKKLEEAAAHLNLNQLYLYTFTAPKLYHRNGWETFETLSYKGFETQVMKKSI